MYIPGESLWSTQYQRRVWFVRYDVTGLCVVVDDGSEQYVLNENDLTPYTIEDDIKREG